MINLKEGRYIVDFGPIGVSGNEELERSWLISAQHIFQMFCSKQKDYGPENIARGGELGVVVRAQDKVARLQNLQGKDPDYEPIEDTWLDLADYGIIGYMVNRGWWPKSMEGPKVCPSCGKGE